MRHRKSKKILGRDRSHRRALLRNLATSFFQHGYIKTTVAKAKTVQPIIERLMQQGKTNSEASRRLLTRRIGNQGVANKIVRDISPHFQQRKGGYTRLIQLGHVRSDGAAMALLELLPYEKTKPKEKQ